MHNILLTGASGYLGGSISAQLHSLSSSSTELPAHAKIYALVRSDAQAQAVRDYGAEPTSFDPGNEAAIESFILGHDVSVVVWFIDVVSVERQTLFIHALAKLRQQTGKEVHFLQVSSDLHLISALSLSSEEREADEGQASLCGYQHGSQLNYFRRGVFISLPSHFHATLTDIYRICRHQAQRYFRI